MLRRYLDNLKTTWQQRYAQEPCARVTDDQCEKLVLGGGGQMWGETADPSDILDTIWPDLAAIAERLWSPRNVTDPLLAAPRLSSFRCHLESRGVPVTPVKNADSRTPPTVQGSCFQQRRLRQ